MGMTYDKAKNWIRAISKMDKRDKICFFTSKNKVENHHVLSVFRLAKFNVKHQELYPEDYPILLAPTCKSSHVLIHQFQNENGHPNHVTEKDLLYMWIWKEQLKAKQNNIIEEHIEKEWIEDYSNIFDNQITAIEDNLKVYNFDPDEKYLKNYFIDETEV